MMLIMMLKYVSLLKLVPFSLFIFFLFRLKQFMVHWLLQIIIFQCTHLYHSMIIIYLIHYYLIVHLLMIFISTVRCRIYLMICLFISSLNPTSTDDVSPIDSTIDSLLNGKKSFSIFLSLFFSMLIMAFKLIFISFFFSCLLFFFFLLFYI